MPLMHAINPLFALSGLVVGMLVGFTGVGGGSFMTPLLVLGFGIPPATAVGTDLLYAGITNIGGSAVHAFHRNVVWRITLRLACGSLPAAALSLLLLAHLGSASKAGGGFITTTLGFALLMTAAALVFRKWLQAHLMRLLDGASERTIGVLTIALGARYRRARDDFFGRGRSDRRDRSDNALSETADRARRRLRHRPRRAAHAHRRPRPFIDGLSQRGVARFAFGRINPGDNDRRPFRVPRSG